MKIEPGMQFVDWNAKRRFLRLGLPRSLRTHCRNGHNLELPKAFHVQRYRRSGKFAVKRLCRCCYRVAQKKRRQKYGNEGRCKTCGKGVVSGRKRCAACLRQRARARKRARSRRA